MGTERLTVEVETESSRAWSVKSKGPGFRVVDSADAQRLSVRIKPPKKSNPAVKAGLLDKDVVVAIEHPDFVELGPEQLTKELFDGHVSRCIADAAVLRFAVQRAAKDAPKTAKDKAQSRRAEKTECDRQRRRDESEEARESRLEDQRQRDQRRRDSMTPSEREQLSQSQKRARQAETSEERNARLSQVQGKSALVSLIFACFR